MEKKNIKFNKFNKRTITNSNNNKGNKKEFKLNYDNDINIISKIKKIPKIDNNYRKKLDKRMDLIMEKIDDNIKNYKYNDLSALITNYKTNSFNSLNNVKNVNNDITNNKNNEKLTLDSNNNNNKNEIKNEIKDNNKSIDKNLSNNINKKNKITEKYEEENIKDNDEEIKMNRSGIFPTKVQIICKRDNEINNKLLKRNKFLENEVNYLKFKLDNVEKQRNFIQNTLIENKNINKSLFDVFLVKYFKNIALNWKDISDEIINELIIDEIHELTKIKLQLRNVKRQEEKKLEKENEENNYISPFEIEEFILFNENLKGIKQVIRSVKESERNLCKKYKVKIK